MNGEEPSGQRVRGTRSDARRSTRVSDDPGERDEASRPREFNNRISACRPALKFLQSLGFFQRYLTTSITGRLSTGSGGAPGHFARREVCFRDGGGGVGASRATQGAEGPRGRGRRDRVRPRTLGVARDDPREPPRGRRRLRERTRAPRVRPARLLQRSHVAVRAPARRRSRPRRGPRARHPQRRRARAAGGIQRPRGNRARRPHGSPTPTIRERCVATPSPTTQSSRVPTAPASIRRSRRWVSAPPTPARRGVSPAPASRRRRRRRARLRDEPGRSRRRQEGTETRAGKRPGRRWGWRRGRGGVLFQIHGGRSVETLSVMCSDVVM